MVGIVTVFNALVMYNKKLLYCFKNILTRFFFYVSIDNCCSRGLKSPQLKIFYDPVLWVFLWKVFFHAMSTAKKNYVLATNH